MYLPTEAVQRLTKAKKFTAMRRRLEKMGIPYTKAWDGEPLVDDVNQESDEERLTREIAQW